MGKNKMGKNKTNTCKSEGCTREATTVCEACGAILCVACAETAWCIKARNSYHKIRSPQERDTPLC